MPLAYTKPEARLARELREVAQDAIELEEILNERLNFEIPEDFPKFQLLNITRALKQLPHGTAEGSRAVLEYARNRLPRIRRSHIISEELEPPQAGNETRQPVVRGALVDRRLSDLIVSVSTALDEYHRQVGEQIVDHDNYVAPTASVLSLSIDTDDALTSSISLEAQISSAKHVIERITKTESIAADNLKRQLNDADGLNRLARTELSMQRVIENWYERLAVKLGEYPDLIRTTINGIKVAADVLEIGVDRWHQFERQTSKFVFAQFRKTCDSFIAIADLLEKRRRQPEAEMALPSGFSMEQAHDKIWLGGPIPKTWHPYVQLLKFDDSRGERGPINPNFMRALAELSHLKSLSLKYLGIQDISSLARLEGLKELKIAHTKVSDLWPAPGFVDTRLS